MIQLNTYLTSFCKSLYSILHISLSLEIILNFLFCSFASTTLHFVNITTEAKDNISTFKPTRKL